MLQGAVLLFLNNVQKSTHYHRIGTQVWKFSSSNPNALTLPTERVTSPTASKTNKQTKKTVDIPSMLMVCRFHWFVQTLADVIDFRFALSSIQTFQTNDFLKVCSQYSTGFMRIFISIEVTGGYS